MYKAQQSKRKTQISRTFSVPSPVGGLNARDSLAEMDPKDAVILDNFYCTPYDVMVRYGFSVWASGITGTVNSLWSYSPPAGSIKMFAAAGANVYDASASGAVGSPVAAGCGSDIWQDVNFGTAGGNFLIAVNGIDLPLVYNGTGMGNIFASAFNTAVTSLTSVGTLATATMAAAHNLKTGMTVVVSGFTPAGYNGTYVITVTGANPFTYVLAGALGVVTVTGIITPSANFAITGINPALFINATVHQSRLWFVEKTSLRIWYLPTLSIGGLAVSIDFSGAFNRGGYLMAMGSWSLDAGAGMDDYAAFVTSEGQVAIYKGSDPASATTWARVGIFDIGSPIGRRCFTKYAGDLTLISKDGLAPLSKALMSSRVNSREMLTDKAQRIMSEYTTFYANNPGWEVQLFPKENMLLMNIPISSTQSYQLVMNTISGAWSQFKGWNAACFVLHGDQLYFGTSTGVRKAWDTQTDNDLNISFEAEQSFNYFGTQSQLKQVKMLRPVISTDGNVGILLGVNVDFDTSEPDGIATFTASVSSLWDSSLWDVGIWSGALTIKKDWQTAFGLGFCVAAHMKGSLSNSKLRWAATDYLVEAGGVV